MIVWNNTPNVVSTILYKLFVFKNICYAVRALCTTLIGDNDPTSTLYDMSTPVALLDIACFSACDVIMLDSHRDACERRYCCAAAISVDDKSNFHTLDNRNQMAWLSSRVNTSLPAKALTTQLIPSTDGLQHQKLISATALSICFSQDPSISSEM